MRSFILLEIDFRRNCSFYTLYVELKEKYTEDAILFAVLQELQDITEGDFLQFTDSDIK